jgi:PDZ domain-containing protein/PEGA domain-containing protein
MRTAKVVFSLLVCASFIAYAQENLLAKSDGNTFDRVRYNGGTVPSRVDPKDWGNHLSINADSIIFLFKDGQRSEINPKSVTSLSYGQEAHRRVGTMIALAILVAPVALFGLFHKRRLHFIGIQYKTPDGKNAGLLLQGDKDNYRAILVALQSVSGVAVSVSDKDREFIPVGVTSDVAKSSSGIQTAAEKAPVVTPVEATTGTVNFVSTPDGADVYVDDQFVGNSPATLKLKPGKRIISAKKSGYGDWMREISISDGSVSLNATLLPISNHQASDSSAQIRPQAVVNYPAQVRPASDSEKGIGWIGIDIKKDANGNLAVVQIAEGGPAWKSGIQVGDSIARLNGAPVKSREQFDVAVASCKPGTQVRVTYMRGAWQTESTMTVGRE